MSPRLTDLPHFVAAHVAIAQAFTALEGVREERGLHPSDCGLADVEHWRLRNGEAGFNVLVKYALGLKVHVTLALAPAQEG